MRRSRRAALAATLAAAIVTLGAGLGSAQDPANTTGEAAAPPAPADLSQAPPDEAAPAAPAAEAEAQPPAPAAPAPAVNPVANTQATVEPAPPPPPPKRPRYTTAVLQALDKVTAETLRFEARVNEPVRYKDLVLTVHACETTAADEDFADSMAHVEVRYQPDVLAGRAPRSAQQVFRGWMSASSPGLNPFQHSIYDVWVIACKTPAPVAAPTTAPAGASL